jgi:MraZ protein
MFRGRFDHTIDPKGRLSIPAKFREVLTERYDSRLVVTTLSGCLIAYPYPEWRILEERIAALPEFKKETRTFLRHFYSSAADCPIDKLGRILIPQALRDYAGLKKDVMLLGTFKQFEIWSKKTWQSAEKKVSLDDIGEMLEKLGL